MLYSIPFRRIVWQLFVQKGLFNGKNRPIASVVIEVMGNLEKDGLGLLRKQDRTTVFLKELPCNLQNNVLQAYGIELDSSRESSGGTSFHGVV